MLFVLVGCSGSRASSGEAASRGSWWAAPGSRPGAHARRLRVLVAFARARASGGSRPGRAGQVGPRRSSHCRSRCVFRGSRTPMRRRTGCSSGKLGSLSLYWMTSPYEGDLGDWHQAHLVFSDPALRPHREFFDSLRGLTLAEQNAEIEREALRNIADHPGCVRRERGRERVADALQHTVQPDSAADERRLLRAPERDPARRPCCRARAPAATPHASGRSGRLCAPGGNAFGLHALVRVPEDACADRPVARLAHRAGAVEIGLLSRRASPGTPVPSRSS